MFAPGSAQQSPQAACAGRFRDASIEAADVPGGVLLIVAVPGPEVLDLRETMHEITLWKVARQEQEGSSGSDQGSDGAMGQASAETRAAGGGLGLESGPGGLAAMPPSSVSVIDTTYGAKVLFEPHRAEDLAALRQAVRDRARAMRQGECPDSW